MITAFKNLSSAESELLVQVPALITILIAGVDNDIDKNEKNWAVKLASYRKSSSHPVLHEYYEVVSDHFENNINRLTALLPAEPEQRNQIISLELEKLNGIFQKMDETFSTKLYDSLLSFAKQIAQASGGILRIGSISEAEQKWVELKMLIPPGKQITENR